jgi:hypothetical protein
MSDGSEGSHFVCLGSILNLQTVITGHFREAEISKLIASR